MAKKRHTSTLQVDSHVGRANNTEIGAMYVQNTDYFTLNTAPVAFKVK